MKKFTGNAVLFQLENKPSMPDFIKSFRYVQERYDMSNVKDIGMSNLINV